MIKKFNYFSFSVIHLSMERVRDILQTLYAEKLLLQKYLMYDEIFDTDLFYTQQPAKGGKHLWKSAFYLPKNTTDEQKIIMFSNAHDGGITLVNRIAIEARTSHITFSLSETDEGKNSMIYRDYERRERVVMTLREDQGKWVFFEKGNKLWFENESYYKRKKINQRLNMKILLEYCESLGLDLAHEDFWSSDYKAVFLEEIQKNRNQ